MNFRDQFLGKIGGIDLGKAPLSIADLADFKTLIDDARKKFKAMVKALPDYDKLDYASHSEGLMLGNRVHSDEAVLARLRGVVGITNEWILDALFDCASSDYWYCFEKEY